MPRIDGSAERAFQGRFPTYTLTVKLLRWPGLAKKLGERLVFAGYLPQRVLDDFLIREEEFSEKYALSRAGASERFELTAEDPTDLPSWARLYMRAEGDRTLTKSTQFRTLVEGLAARGADRETLIAASFLPVAELAHMLRLWQVENADRRAEGKLARRYANRKLPLRGDPVVVQHRLAFARNHGRPPTDRELRTALRQTFRSKPRGEFREAMRAWGLRVVPPTTGGPLSNVTKQPFWKWVFKPLVKAILPATARRGSGSMSLAEACRLASRLVHLRYPKWWPDSPQSRERIRARLR